MLILFSKETEEFSKRVDTLQSVLSENKTQCSETISKFKEESNEAFTKLEEDQVTFNSGLENKFHQLSTDVNDQCDTVKHSLSEHLTKVPDYFKFA